MELSVIVPNFLIGINSDR